MLNRLIVINIAVYLAIWILAVLIDVFGFLMQNDSIQEVFGKMMLSLECPASFQQLLRQPWAIVTSLFMHAGIWHLFVNMLMLYVMGRIFTQFLDDKKLLLTYFLGGIAGNLLYMLAYNAFPVFAADIAQSYAVGASGSIMAIMASITMYRPNYEMNLWIIGRVKLYWIMIFFVILDVLSIQSIQDGNAGGHIAHLGGVLYGCLSQYAYRSKSSTRKKVDFKAKKKKEKYASSAPHDAHWRPMTDEEYNTQKVQEQQKIDQILDKISKNGYDALSKEEKDFLFNYSKK
ncbi:rhomboid family intramembrane serine protease [Bacteroidales bacterium OttesenSCG-928-A14]|nr:rhomboid family intramembrane serine protease [Bacteroidales bacterium OttesenSCG-928-A14]